MEAFIDDSDTEDPTPRVHPLLSMPNTWDNASVSNDWDWQYPFLEARHSLISPFPTIYYVIQILENH